PKQDKIDILKYEGDINYSKLFDTFLGFSMPMQQRSYGKSLDEIKSMFKLENILPVISSDKAVYSIFGDVKGNKCESVNSMIDDYYSFQIEQHNLVILKSDLLSIVKPRLKKAENTLLKLHYRLDKAKGGNKYRIYGDLIMANLYKLKDYVEDVDVVNFSDNKPVKIFLDKTKTLKENANSFYKLYNKAKKTLENTTEYFSKVQQEKDYLEQVMYSINSAETIAELEVVKLEIMPEKAVKKLEKHSFEPLNIKVDDCEVYIGKNNRQNDFIVSKLAKDEDLWFHVHNCAGSHVLLKSKNPDDETILKCAHLAKKYSSAAESSKVGVIYTFAKNLKKPPHSNLGYVIYKGEKEIVL
ncbi:MAG: NFACT RNA binding domain-containing protein, partial [Clostridiaceae bacterium]|nr:NFACT RNA binding domain-containing protein [Clostridiaceae bacterium]